MPTRLIIAFVLCCLVVIMNRYSIRILVRFP